MRTDNKGRVIDTTAALESGRYAKRGDERGRHEEDASKRKVAHEHSRRERATSVARQTAPQSTGWGGGGWFGAATQPTTTGWNYRW